MTDVIIASAARTPIGAFSGAFATVPAAGSRQGSPSQAAMERSNVAGADVDDVIMGQVLTADTGQNPARQAAMSAGVPKEKTALTINQVCGSGLRAVAMAGQAIQAGDAEIVVAGGQESMSQSPHTAAHMRAGHQDGRCRLYRHHDPGRPVGRLSTATTWAPRRKMSPSNGKLPATTRTRLPPPARPRRKRRRNPASSPTRLSPVVVPNRKGDITVDTDEYPRHGTTAEKLAKLRPAFSKDGTVTAGNASGINDGAAALVLMSPEQAEKRGVEPLARIVSWATTGVDPALMGSGPIPASREALEKAGWSIDDVDLVESNEAFAAQSCAVARDLGFDMDKVNVNGGAIALGHPIGASGARILTTLLYEMKRRDAKKGLATLCIGGGMGIAMCVARD